ncbi:UDP-glucose 4-epimerase family protein [Denitromonas ohlonensis]|uniref:SDR family oxidoreductase n=2 Tax=Denitromonas TaxID=139331 RepID=A0A557R555_9RHOO|nr:SDR family oxidoreductase [Denitromonas ohlonensis]TVO60256.1 SDR family oxidoreductase [Denitromonas ohlonensis]TVO75765.1 SDR family oxidoreductase [Denitromonas ohlonensis]
MEYLTAANRQARVVVTGASGFVAQALIRSLAANDSVEVCAASRSIGLALPDGVSSVSVGDLGPETDWAEALDGVDVVVHCAARVHMMSAGRDDEALYRRINVDGTLRLARTARSNGCRRFIYLSSIKVNGERTVPGCPFSPNDPPRPVDAYGRSKLMAEQGLLALAHETGLEVVIIRPPLVYGPGVKANFRRMAHMACRGWPLPLGRIHNQRSLVNIENLVHLIVTCLDHPMAPGHVFLVSDGQDVSTSELLRKTAHALSCRIRLLPVPAGVLVWVARMVGKSALADRLCGNLQVDISPTQEVLNWRPPLTLDEGLRRFATQDAEFGGHD